MTPKMVEALRDAASGDRTGGLHRSNAGWSVQNTYHWHKFATVNALINRGYLSVFGGGRGLAPYAVTTPAGEAMLLELGYNRDGSKA